MLQLLLAFAAGGILAPLLIGRMGPRAFLILALFPALAFAYTMAQAPAALWGEAPTQYVPWISQLDIALSFRLDPLAWIMGCIVSLVGAIVLVACATYFDRDEPHLGRFAALLLTFAGVMYGLVTTDDAIIMFMFWEMTSILSYLLIGHYTGRRESRGAALQALLVTTIGGLAMLVGLVILIGQAGTTSLAGIVAAGPDLHGGLVTTAVFLVLAGAFSKSALFPAHFWLPAAMAAPTPVSAYLHAAAMVKAGVYLVARLAPGYAETPGWVPTIVLLGGWTMLLGGWRSLRQYDLKLVLAYGTISQLGFLTIMVGFGQPDVMLAGLALTVAHALYKSTLFLIVGIIDHRTGTRDWRQLSGIGRRHPYLATLAGVAIASMIGLPPLLGFAAKEVGYAALLGVAPEHGWAWAALAFVAVGSVFTGAYGFRFFWGAFARKDGVDDTATHHASRWEYAAPTAATLLTIAGGLFAGRLDALLSPAASLLPGHLDEHVALWHGWGLPLLISALTVAIAILMFVKRRQVTMIQYALHGSWDAGRAYWAVIRAVDAFSARLTTRMQRGGVSRYIATIMGLAVVSLSVGIVLNRTWPDSIRPWDYAAQPAIAFVMILAAIAATHTMNRFTSALLVGVTGYGLVALFAFHGAPDLALTQALVETISVVVFVLVFRRLPPVVTPRKGPKRKLARALLGALVGLVMAGVAIIALGARTHGSVSDGFPALTLEAHGTNIVNVVLVDIRAWDTMGEVSVLVAVATGVASLLFVTGRAGTLPRIGGSRQLRSRDNLGRTLLEPAVSVATRGNAFRSQRRLREDDAPDSRRAWLLAGRTLDQTNRSILVEVLVRFMFHPAIIISLYLLLVGHTQPGGGFAGGLLASLALVARYLAGGRYELAEAVPIDAGKILGLGVLLTSGTAAASLLFGADALTSTWFEADLPALGTLSVGTTTIFDVGVYLIVFGVSLDILRTLGAEIDRQAEEGLTSSPGQSADNDPPTLPIPVVNSRGGEGQ